MYIFAFAHTYKDKNYAASSGELTPKEIRIAWPFFLLLVYGFLIAIGVEAPAVSDCWVLIISIILFLLCIFWSSIIWLQVQGMELDNTKEPEKPEADDNLKKTANTLPKITPTNIES